MIADEGDYESLFSKWQGQQDEGSRNQLLEAIYGDLRKLAAGMLQLRRNGPYTRPTELANAFIERKFLLYSRLNWLGRAQFYSLLSVAMRRFLIDASRQWVDALGLDVIEDKAGGGSSDHAAALAYQEAIEGVSRVKPHWGLLLDWRITLELSWEDIHSLAANAAEFEHLDSRDVQSLKYEFRKAKAWLKLHHFRAARESSS
jgi:ECF sigma factor